MPASAGAAIAQADVVSSLKDAGFALNPTLEETYKGVVAGTGATSDMDLMAAYIAVYPFWEASLAEYGDAALMTLGAGKGEVHNQQLDKVQLGMIDYVAEHFDTVIVLINTCTPIELKAIQDNEKVDAVLMIGEAGDNGFEAIGKILCGEVNPSGRTVDTWAADFTKAPSYMNANINTENDAHSTDGNGQEVGYTQYTVDGELKNTWAVGYEEGIYIGYRYYETRAYEEAKAGNDGWFDENVVYTFGYGLSYTDFAWEITPVTAAGSAITKADTLEFDVKVTNTGDKAGRDVVELYYTAPFGTEETGNETVIEKAYVVLGDFAKTKELAPGESETVRVAIKAKDMASYDYATDKTYVLDAGAYGIKIAQSAHFGAGKNDAEFIYTVAEKALCNEAVTGNEITNALDDVTDGFVAEGYQSLSRLDFAGTMPDTYVKNKEITAEEYATFAYDDAAFNAYYDAAAIGEVKVADAADRTTDTYSIVLADLIGAPADDLRYDELVAQLTIDELIELVNFGGFNSRGVPYIGKPYSRDTDGPKGWTGNYTDTNDRFNYFSSEPLIGSTWSKEILYEMGKVVGDQGLWGNSTVSSGNVYSYTGWYGPGMNLHRSPLLSRYTEYYSEDPVLTGVLAANVSQGALSKDCYITLKHFAFHEDGGGAMTYRMGAIGSGSPNDGLCAYMTEQTAREIYLKCFQIAVEEGDARFAMGSFTRIGKIWCGGNYAVNQKITRDEWGFKGAVVTDITLYWACNAYQLIKAGSDMMLDAFVYGLNFGVFLDKDTIYVGYRYYETRGYEEEKAGNADWYAQNVSYPFGYGLSYTTFDWNVKFGKADGSAITAADTLTATVTVKNTGSCAGKDVVQLYYSAPYDYEGSAIEKPYVVLGDFVKTRLLNPGESQEVTLTLAVRDMKSYDYADANQNGFKGYELDAGAYGLIVASDAHTAKASAQYTLSEAAQLSTIANAQGEEVTVENRFDDVSAGIFGDTTYASYVSRKDFEGTMPKTYLADERRSLTDDLKTELDNSKKRKYTASDEGMPWEVKGDAPAATAINNGISLRDMLNDENGNLVGKASFDDARWEKLLDEISLDEMKGLVGFGAFRTNSIAGVDNIVDKPMTIDADGPSGFTSFISEADVYGTCLYQAEAVMGATWNVELAQQMGEIVGDEGNVGNEKTGVPYSGWYAPAVNIHRSPFAGRNWEYYSEDGALSGKFAASVIQGAKEKGVYCYVKHFAINDQETDREYNGILVWANEQAMREIYLKPFEIAVKEGGAGGMMSSFNRIGMKWAGGSYPLLTSVLRDEWGFRGMVITDYSLNTYTHVDEMIRAGGDLFLTQDTKTFNKDDDATQITLLRKATKNILYTVVNSNAMSVNIEGYLKPLWQEWMVYIDIALGVLLVLWGVGIILATKKNPKPIQKKKAKA